MKRFDAIVLLGVELDENDQPTEELIARTDAAANAYEKGLAANIVVCGGRLPGHAVSEADVMERLLAERNIPADAVIKENKSQDTMENMRFAARLLGDKKHVLVVTSDYHVRRAVMTARRTGFKAKGYAAVFVHDVSWKEKKRKELAYTLDLIMGWQDEGKSRPEWTYTLFDAVFGGKGQKR